MINALKNLIYQTDGKYTQELKLENSACVPSKLPKKLLPDGIVKSVCGYCSTGCCLDIHIKDKQPINIMPTPDYPVNLAEACPKGWEALTPLKAADRAVSPLLRNREGKFEEVSWFMAMEEFVNRFTAIMNKYGRESVAFISTGQIPTEEMVLLGAVAKFGMGWVHGDGNTRQCMATAAVAYKEAFGFDAPPFTYKDFEESDVIVFVGANPCIAHPIMWQRVCMNRHNPEIVVIDPRKTETAMAATRHYAIRPKSDLLFFYCIANELIKRGHIDENYIKNHTRHFDEFRQHVSRYGLEETYTATGLPCGSIEEFCSVIQKGRRVSFWWTMGVNQGHEAVRTAQAIINIALVTGNIGRPGTGANSITGQCNAMGSRLYSNTTNLLGGHDFTNEEHRAKIADILNIDKQRIPEKNSLAYDQIIEGVVQNKIKGLWVIATNPGHSWINRNELEKYIKNLDFLVVQDMYYTTETARMADLILPAAGWGEKEGTFINSERRIGLMQKVADPPGQALTDFEIFKWVAEHWGCGRMFAKWVSPEAVFQIMKKISQGQPCDITGIDNYDMLEKTGGIQWPFRKGDALGTNERRLFEDGQYFHEDKKARFVFADLTDNPEPISDEFPFELLTGRGTSSQWHTQSRTSKSKILKKMYPEQVYAEINPEDARRMNIFYNETICISTKRGKIKAHAVITPAVKPGQIFLPMHYEETNRLTFPAFDPYSRQPAYKYSAACISKTFYE